jgi:hypothetical protein
MYRKWSLYEGMRWTPYIAARLQTWQDKGLGNLHKLLALTGITLEEAKKQYSGWQAVGAARGCEVSSQPSGTCIAELAAPVSIH